MRNEIQDRPKNNYQQIPNILNGVIAAKYNFIRNFNRLLLLQLCPTVIKPTALSLPPRSFPP